MISYSHKIYFSLYIELLVFGNWLSSFSPTYVFDYVDSQFRDVPAGPMPPATPKFAYGFVSLKKVL